MPTSVNPTKTAAMLESSRSGRPAPASASAPQKVDLVPNRCTTSPATGVVNIDGRKTKYTKPSCIGLIASGSRAKTKFT